MPASLDGQASAAQAVATLAPSGPTAAGILPAAQLLLVYDAWVVLQELSRPLWDHQCLRGGSSPWPGVKGNGVLSLASALALTTGNPGFQLPPPRPDCSAPRPVPTQPQKGPGANPSPRIRFQPPCLMGEASPPPLLALSLTAPSSALSSSSIQIHFLEQSMPLRLCIYCSL